MAAAFVPLEKKCMVPKEHHIGTFPGNFCIKMMGESGKSWRIFVGYLVCAKNIVPIFEKQHRSLKAK